MKSQQALERLEDIVAQDMPALEKNAIVRDGDDYWLFGRYEIQRRNHGVLRVTKGINLIADMTSMRAALSWCIADKYQQWNLSREILNLENHRNLLLNDIHARSALSQRIRTADLRESVGMKIQTRRERLLAVEQRLDKCINLAKYWQIRGFQHETARTGRTASHRINR